VPEVALRQRARARLFQFLYPYVIRVDKDLYFATRPVAKPEQVRVPTRHGPIRCLLYRPHPDAPLAANRATPPVHFQIHGGGFVARDPEQDTHIINFICSEVGATVVSLDYDVAPQAQYPTAEEECYDVAKWIADNGGQHGWDSSRMSVLGISAGGKLAINVAQQAYDTKAFALRALMLAYATNDMSRTDRTSPLARPRAGVPVQQLAGDTYIPDLTRRREPLASPIFDTQIAQKVPPTLILTGEYDTLGPEMDQMADDLAAAGVHVTHHRFAKTDHGFMHFKPVGPARESMNLIQAHMLANLG
jgi:acetyl esterase